MNDQLAMFGARVEPTTAGRRSTPKTERTPRGPAQANEPDLFGGAIRPLKRRHRYTPDRLAERLASLASALPMGLPHAALALTVIGVMLAEHGVASDTYDAIASSANPATSAVDLLAGGVALTPQLWSHTDPLVDALRESVGEAGHERAVGQIAEVLADADLDNTFTTAPSSGSGDSATLGPDLLGDLYSRLRSHSGKRDRGAFYTPTSLALLMGQITPLEEGMKILDPAVGSGIMMWGAATAMREADLDPRSCTWFGVDIDPVAIAIAAVNAVVWRLHDRVVLYNGNGLTADLPTMVEAERERLRAGRGRYLAALAELDPTAECGDVGPPDPPERADDLSA